MARARISVARPVKKTGPPLDRERDLNKFNRWRTAIPFGVSVPTTLERAKHFSKLTQECDQLAQIQTDAALRGHYENIASHYFCLAEAELRLAQERRERLREWNRKTRLVRLAEMIKPMAPRHASGPNSHPRQPQPHRALASIRRDGLLRIVCVMALMATIATTASARDIYRWSRNVAVAPFESSRQQGETALVTDSGGRMWLSFIDAEYRQVAGGTWLAWPRALRLFTSGDGGKTFRAEPNLSTDSAGDQALAVDTTGRVYASFVNYFTNPRRQQIVLQRLDAAQAGNSACLPFDQLTTHDQSNVHAGRDDVVYIVGVDIKFPANPAGTLLYASSRDGGTTCVDQRRLSGIGELPQILDTQFGLLIVGPNGYYTSGDGGRSFSGMMSRPFGAKLTRSALSPDRHVAYAVGDSTAGGLRIHMSADGGKSWHVTRVDDAVRATAWRYPAVHVESGGRVHVAWMDDRAGFGAVYHSYSEDAGRHFSPNTRVSDQPFRFPANAPAPPPGTQDGTWIGDYLSLTTTAGVVILAWSDQRAGAPKSVVQVVVGAPAASSAPAAPVVTPQLPAR